MVFLVWACRKIIKLHKIKNKKYFVKILFVTCVFIILLCILCVCGFAKKIPAATNKQNMETAVTYISLLDTLLFLSIMLMVLSIMIACDIYKKSKSLSLRTEFDFMSLIYFLIMTAVCVYHIRSLTSITNDPKDLGEAIIKWWFILPLFISNWFVYFLMCLYITKIKLNQHIDLFIEKSIKSCLIGIAAWSVLFFNLRALVKIPEFFNYFKYFCILGNIFPIFYPSLDMYEYTILEMKEALY